MSENIFAYTEVDYPKDVYYPAFISINESDTKVTLSVRGQGKEYPSDIDISDEVLEEMATAIISYLNNK